MYVTKNRRSPLLLVPTGVLAVLLVAACGGGAGPQGPGTAAATSTADARASTCTVAGLPQDVLDAAAEEGQVNVWTASSVANYEEFYKDAFEDAFPDITVNLYRANGPDRDTRFMNEFEAGVSDVDIMAGSAAGPNARMKPEGMLKSVRPYLTDEVLDGSGWEGGEAPWMDEEQEYLLQSDHNTVPVAAVSPEAPPIESWADLLDPALDGKINAGDPRQGARGLAIGLFAYHTDGLGPDYATQLYGGGRVVFSEDSRQQAIWLDQGEHWVNLGPNYQEYEDLAEIGSDDLELIQSLELNGEQVGAILSADGIAYLPNLDPLPHDNAARVYLNWFYGQCGQQAMVDVLGYNSARSDVDTSSLPDYLVPRADARYVNLNHLTSSADVTSMREHIASVVDG